jgi:hypothetical protein
LLAAPIDVKAAVKRLNVARGYAAGQVMKEARGEGFVSFEKDG